MLGQKLKSIFKLDFSNLHKKILKSIIIIVVLVIIAVISYYFLKLKNTGKYLTYKYTSQIESFLPETSKSIINIKKVSSNQEKFVVLLANIEYINKYTDSDINNIVSNVNSYNDVEILYINKDKAKVISLATDTNFPVSINLDIVNIDDNEYAFVNSPDSDSIIFTKLNDDRLDNLITKNFGNNFTGYSISSNFDSENSNILKVKLDYDKKEHLKDINTEYSLDFSKVGQQLKNYRKSYLNSNFNYITLEDIDKDNKLELVGYQNLLYLNSNNNKLGKVITYFNINDEQITFKNVEVKE